MTSHERFPAIAAAVLVAAIALLTLSPSGDSGSFGPILCFACGDRGVADALLNIILFMPLGAALFAVRHSVPRAALLASAVSLSVEIAQIWIPGRDSNPGDLTFNTLGAVLGACILLAAPRLMTSDAHHRRVVAAFLLLFSLGILGAGAVLLRPHLPQTVYWGQWTPKFEHMAWYGGEILDARLGDLPIPSRRLADSDAVRARLRAGAPIRIVFVPGPPVRRLAPVFSIADGGPSSIRQIGIEGDDAVLRFRTLSTVLRLDQPSIRIREGFAGLEMVDTVFAVLRTDGEAYCLEVNRSSQCGIGYVVADTWQILYSAGSWPAWLVGATGLAWLAGLFAPAGLFLASLGELAAAAASAALGLFLIPGLTPVLPTGAPELVGALVGLSSGALLRRVLHLTGVL